MRHNKGLKKKVSRADSPRRNHLRQLAIVFIMSPIYYKLFLGICQHKRYFSRSVPEYGTERRGCRVFTLSLRTAQGAVRPLTCAGYKILRSFFMTDIPLFKCAISIKAMLWKYQGYPVRKAVPTRFQVPLVLGNVVCRFGEAALVYADLLEVHRNTDRLKEFVCLIYRLVCNIGSVKFAVDTEHINAVLHEAINGLFTQDMLCKECNRRKSGIWW